MNTKRQPSTKPHLSPPSLQSHIILPTIQQIQARNLNPLVISYPPNTPPIQIILKHILSQIRANPLSPPHHNIPQFLRNFPNFISLPLPFLEIHFAMLHYLKEGGRSELPMFGDAQAAKVTRVTAEDEGFV